MEPQNDLETYKLLWDRITHEVDEVYTINNLFLVMAGAVLAGTAAVFGKSLVHIVAGVLGIVIAWYWRASLTAQLQWKNWWIAEAAELEKRLGLVRIWRNIAGETRGEPDAPRPPPQVAAVSDPLHSMWLVFGIVSTFSFAYGIYLASQ